MTDEERRKKLVIDLRGYEGYDRRLNTMVHQAANEIERLAEELVKAITLCGDMLQGQYRLEKAALAQSDAEPVAWQDTDLAGINITGLEAPPRPDASAGLIEAAEFLEEKARYKSGPTDRLLRDWAKHLRARAADRSTK